MKLEGSNTVCLDLETLRSTSDCRHCGQPKQAHYNDGACEDWRGDKPADHITQYAPIGWNNHALLGLSIGCVFSYRDMRYHFFDQHTLAATMHALLVSAPLIVSYNGRGFDGPLMQAVHGQTLDGWGALWERSYDILWEIWRVDADSKYVSGLNGLDAVSQANGFGAKEMDGAMAPRLWAQGRCAEVANYCMSDVYKTRRLFEKTCQGEAILRGNGQEIWLPVPERI